MGNNPSKPAGAAPASPAAGPSTHSQQRRNPAGRRESLQHPSSNPTTAPQSLYESPNNSQAQSLASPNALTPKPYPHSHHRGSHSAGSSPVHGQSSSKPDDRMGNAQSRQAWREKQETRKREQEQEQQSNPVRVPGSSYDRRQKGPDSQFESSGPPRDPNYIPVSNLNFPPRLPLPIQEEVYTPGSPIISPADLASALDEAGSNGAFRRRTSLLSHTTVDEDETEDELQSFGLEGARGGTVPTLVEWKRPGDRVYITGTFAAWSKKYRMHRDPSTNVLSTVLELPPGTHHVKFIVDGEMQLSDELPTAVDYTNILVNYIEVNPDDIPQGTPSQDGVPEGVFPPQLLPPGIESKDHAPDSVGKTQPTDPEGPAEPVYYGDDVPPYLLDLDREEKTNRFQRAAGTVSDIPTPPSLPLFLGKSILNGTTPMKDDSSVLNMPNHTVLNHLATSSIKNEVLATSLTTRYKRKYVTTIMYRPTNVDDY
ncbi:hypothetical protein MMC34_001516 [Xylographa carneopallida]|nr:hypothetical protein [Xylographa carneopallida]